MAEETEMTEEKEPTATEVAERLSEAKRSGQLNIKFWNYGSYPFGPEHFIQFRRVAESCFRIEGVEGNTYIFVPDTTWAANTNELALVAAGVTEENPQGEKGQSVPAGAHLTAEENTARVLINSALSEVERSRAIMQRDTEEIQRLKEETRAILTKLQAA
jgi:hypothetical protein